MAGHLVERDKAEIREINLALEKMASGQYGLCEVCEEPIESERLAVLPATRLCSICAQNYEKLQKVLRHPRDEIIDDELLDEYRNLLENRKSETKA